MQCCNFWLSLILCCKFGTSYKKPNQPFLFQTFFHVINRTTGKSVSTRFYGDALVVFHHINAYEDEGHLVCDLITYKDSSLYNMFYIRNVRQDTDEFVQSNQSFYPPVCKRFVFPLNVNKVKLVQNTQTITFLNVRGNTWMLSPGFAQRI